MAGAQHSQGTASEPSQRPADAAPQTRVKLGSNAIAGVVAGFTTCVTTHPLDVVKTRFQVQDGHVSKVPKYSGTLQALVSIGRSEGVRTLYAGLAPNLVGSTVSWGCYFYGYNYLRGIARKHDKYVDARGQLGPGVNMVCATCAGVSTCVATNPIWLVKTRLQLQDGRGEKRLRGMVHALRHVVREEGVAGLYNGILPSLLLVSHGALQFMCYEEIKKLFQMYANNGDEHLSTFQTFFTGAVAKVFASVATYPSQVVRARLQQVDPNWVSKSASQPQQERYYKGTVDVIRKILRHEGASGFYKGLAPNLMRVVPSAAITFAVYEKVAKVLGAKT